MTPDLLTQLTQLVNERYALLCRSTRVESLSSTKVREIEQGLQALDNLLRNDLRTLARKGAPDEFADIYFALQRELERFREFCAFPALANKFVVAFGGGFSAGKSSLINAILGKRLLVTEVDPTTSLPTYLLKGERDEISALNLFGQCIGMSDEEFLSLTHDEVLRYGSNVSRLLRAAFITRTDFVWNNIAIVDIPGYTKHENGVQSERTDEHIARSQLNTAQAIVWVIDARQGCITEDDVKFLSSLHRDIPLYIALSRADQKPEEDIPAIVSGVETMLISRNIPFIGITPVSAHKTPAWPLDFSSPLITQLCQWNEQQGQLRFVNNFKVEFTRYADFLAEERHQAQQHLEQINRILVMTEDKDTQTYAKELKKNAQLTLKTTQANAEQLQAIWQNFGTQLKALGHEVGVNMSLDIKWLNSTQIPAAPEHLSQAKNSARTIQSPIEEADVIHSDFGSIIGALLAVAARK